MKTSFHSFAYGGRSWLPSCAISEVIRRVGALGFDAVEIAAVRPHAWPPDLDGPALKKLKRLIRQADLEVSAICPAAANHNPVSPIRQERADAILHYTDCLHLAAELGAGRVTLAPGWRVRGTPAASARGWLWDALDRLADEAGRAGVVVALEAVNPSRTNLVTSTAQVLDLVRQAGSPYLKGMIDLYHSFLSGESVAESIRLLGKDLDHVHFVDAARGSLERQVPGTGDAPLREALDALAELGYTGYLTVEVWGSDPDRLGAQAMDFFRKELHRK